jgi:predicted acetyltransferase
LENVILIDPSVEYKNEYTTMMNEWMTTGEHRVPFVLRMDCSDFGKMVNDLIGFRNGINIPETFVNHSTFWLVNTDREILGVTSIRHHLNARLLIIGGHIGYGITPSKRRKGLATKILYLALEKAKGMGLNRVLLTCDKNNIGSAKTIVNNGGVLDSEEVVDGDVIQRYWITM